MPLSPSVKMNLVGAFIGASYLKPVKTKEPRKPVGCLNCGEPHYHNNCWCSVECKQQYEQLEKFLKAAT